MFTSFHRVKLFYPNSGELNYKGKYGTIHNYPFYENCTVEEYMDSFNSFMVKANHFEPAIIFISCGFDNHKDDHYHALPLTVNEFKTMTKELCILANKYCNGRLISVLEGGYTPSVVADCASVHINELLNN